MAATNAFIISFLTNVIYSENKFMPHFARERTYTCQDRECSILCSTGHCGNEVFKSKYSNFNATTLQEPEITVNCEDFLSCYGQIKIEQYAHRASHLLALPYQRAGHSTIKCSDSTEEQSCRGGMYLFDEFSTATMIGNARESIIAYKNGGTARIIAAGKLQEETQFYMNQVYTENLNSFGVNAGDFAVTGSYIDLRGLQTKFGGMSTFKCHGKGSCAGLIIVVKYCGPQVHIMCDGKGSCGMLSIFLTKGDCEETEKFPGIKAWKNQYVTRQTIGNNGELIENPPGWITSAYKEYPWKDVKFKQKPTVLISGTQGLDTPIHVYTICTDLCEDYAENHDEQAAISEFMVQVNTKRKERKRSGLVYEPFDGKLHRYYSVDKWIEDTQKHLGELDTALKTTKDEKYEDARQYIFNDGHATFAGIMFEATLSQVTGQAVKIPWMLGQEFDRAILNAIGVGLAAGGAVLMPLIIPGIIMAGFGVYYVIKRTMGTDRKKAGYFGAHAMEVDNMMDTYDGEMRMDGNELMDYCGLQLNSDGDVIEYDVLTGKIHGYEVHKNGLYHKDGQLVATEIFGIYFAALILFFCCITFVCSFALGFIARRLVNNRKRSGANS